MKILTLGFITFFVLAGSVYAQNKDYDSVLAKKLQADDYGMRSYILVILKKGATHITDTTLRDSLFKGHMANINKLADENKLSLAGPLGDNDKTYRGIFVLNTSSMDEAKQWVNSDPTVQAKIFDVEYYEWYGSAALLEIPSLHKKVQKKDF